MFEADVEEVKLTCPEELRDQIEKDPCFVADLRLYEECGMLECEADTIKYGSKQVRADLEELQSAGVRGHIILGLGQGQYTRFKLTDDGVWQAFGVIAFGDASERHTLHEWATLKSELAEVRCEKENLEMACADYIDTITRQKKELDEAHRAVVKLVMEVYFQKRGEV